MAGDYYPPGGFYFGVSVVGSGSGSPPRTDIDASFAEVSGIQAEFGVEEVEEGGENRFVHRLPRPPRYGNLVLRRGIVTRDSFLARWAASTLGSNLARPIATQNLLVTLLDAGGAPLIAWGFVNAYPLRWQVAPLNAMESKILIETLELSYNYFDRINLGGAGSAAYGQLDRFSAQLG